MIQAATPAAAPTLAERASVAAESARAHTAVIGTSQPNVSATATPDASEASSPRTVFSPNTARARTSSTIRSLTARLQDSSQASSMPGPYAYAMPAAATPGATNATTGKPVSRVARIPAARTTAVATIQPSHSDGVVTSARARPGDRSTHRAD